MTEKRFKLLYSKLDNGMFVDREKQFEDIIIDKEFQKVSLIKVVDLLNKLADENKKLKSEYKVLHTQYQDLQKFVENNFDEYLTQQKLNRQIIKLSNENKQLKQQVAEIINMEDNI